jgi:hypothetical protein
MIPHTDWERLALLEEIEQGIKIVLPVDEEHARNMIQVAQFYLNQHHEHTVKLLKAEYGN